MKRLILLFGLTLAIQLQAQQTIPLYPGEIPNSHQHQVKEVALQQEGAFFGYSQVSQPTLTAYLPEQGKATGTAVVICPGGGYAMECFLVEGTRIAEAFLRQGIAAFVLKYRLPSDSTMTDKSIGPLQDAQQAILTVRQRAAEWQIDPHRIGIMGFSAGGHLASTAGTHFEHSYIPNQQQISLRPDFMILIYPVIIMREGLAHQGSKENLLGTNPSEAKTKLFSNDLQVNANTPPTWITHTGDDTVVPVENSIRFYQALISHKVPTEMHLYPTGNHGFVLKIPADEWMSPLFIWLKFNFNQ